MNRVSSASHYWVDLRRYYRLPIMQVSLTVVVSIVIVAVFVALAIRPTLIAIVGLRKSIIESREMATKLESKVKNLQQASSILESIKPQIPELNQAISGTGADYAAVVEEIEQLASATQVQLQSETLGETLLYLKAIDAFAAKRENKVIPLKISLRVTGTYPKVVEFVRQLMRVPRKIGVKSMVINRETSATRDSVTVGATINGEIYYMANSAIIEQVLTKKEK